MTKIGLFSSKVFFSILLCSTIFAFLGCSDLLISSPTNLKVEKIYSDRIDLSWDPQLGATSYNLYFSKKNSFSSASALNVLLESAVGISGFEPNTKYYIWVTACNFSGESEPSQMVTATTFIGAPNSVEMSFSEDDLILSWDIVPDATGYEIYFGKKSQIDETTTKFTVSDSNFSGSKITKTFENVALTDGIYYVWVFSKDDKNTSTNYASNKKRKGQVYYQFHIEQANSTKDNYSLSVEPSGTEVFLIKTNVSQSSVAKEKTGGVLEVHENTLQNSSRNLAHFSIIGEKISRENEYGDQIIESTPIRVDHKLSSEFNNTILNDYLSKKHSGRLESNVPQQRTNVTYKSYELGATKDFWVDDSSVNFSKKTATLRAVGDYSYIWVVDDVYDNSSVQKDDNELTKEQIEATAKKFDEIYGPATTIFGQTYKTFYENDVSGINNALVPPEEKISILICDIWDDSTSVQNSGIVGYFWSKDFGKDSDDNKYRSNECEIFYIDSYFLDSYTEMTYSTLAHEFQHMLNFVNKYIELNKYAETEAEIKSPSTWYNEMLSMVCEDLLQDIIGIEDKDSPRSRLTLFNNTYLLNGLNEWWEDPTKTLFSYAHAYALGAFISRNYGGAAFVKSMVDNEYVNLESIVNAIKTHSGKNYSTSELLKEFARALCYPDGFDGSEDDKNTSLGQAKEAGLKHFYRGNTCSIGEYEYTLKPIKLADYPFSYTTPNNENFTSYGPYLFDVGEIYDLRPYGISVHTFGLKSNEFTFDYVKPESSNVVSYFVIQ